MAQIVQSLESLVLCWLSTRLNLNRKRLDQVLQKYPSLSRAVSDNFQALPLDTLKWLKNWVPVENLLGEIDKLLVDLEAQKISFFTILDSNFPPKLKILSDCPTVLFYQGDIQLLTNPEMLTVVGSRNITKQAETIMDLVVKPVCSVGIGTVSGLAVGVDTKAHQIALQAKAPTIAVIGSGLDTISFYPQANLSLKAQILDQNGLILSEYAPGTNSTIYTFPQRNRILAALSELTLVVQADHKSGSLITAGVARDLGKTVATLPASITDKAFSGNLKLLKEGANLVTEPEDIFQLLGLTLHSSLLNNQAEKVIEFTSDKEEKVYKNLNLIGENVEILAENLNLDIIELNEVLTMLELNGLVVSLGNNIWRKGM